MNSKEEKTTGDNVISTFLACCVFILGACNSTVQSQQNNTDLEGKAKEYYKKKVGKRPTHSELDHLSLLRRDMEGFKEDRISLGGGFKYRIRPSKSPYWRYLAVGGSGIQYIVDLKKKKKIKVLKNAGGAETSWHPNKPWLVGMAGGILRITDVLKEEILKKWKPTVSSREIRSIYDLKFFPNGKKIIFTYTTTDHKKNARFEIWDLSQKNPIHIKTPTRNHQKTFGQNIRFLDSGKYFTFDQRATEKSEINFLSVWNTGNLKQAFQVKTKQKDYIWLRFQKLFGRKYLFARGSSNKLEIFPVPAGTNNISKWSLSNLEPAGIRDYEVAEYKKGKIVEIEDEHGDVSFFILQIDPKKGITRREKFASIGPGNRIGDVRFGPEGEKIYLVTSTGDLWIYSVKKLLNAYRKHTNIEGYYRWKAKKKFGGFAGERQKAGKVEGFQTALIPVTSFPSDFDTDIKPLVVKI